MTPYNLKYAKHANALFHALREDAFYKTMEQSVLSGSPEQAMLRYMDYSMQEAEQFGKLFIPEPTPFGASIWSQPLDKATANERNILKKDFLKTQMGDNSLQTYNSIVECMAERTDQVVSDDYWYLSIVGVLPEFQGKGLGQGLLGDVLQEADTAGVPTYLETFTPRNISFYQRLGYESQASFLEPTTGSEYWVMVRPAHK